MSNIVEKIGNAELSWYWSLKPGTFVDQVTGKNPYPDMVIGPWTGTLEQWNVVLFAMCVNMATELLGQVPGDETTFHIPETLYSKATQTMVDRLMNNDRKIRKNNQVPYNMICVVAGDKVGVIKVLNINDKGNLV